MMFSLFPGLSPLWAAVLPVVAGGLWYGLRRHGGLRAIMVPALILVLGILDPVAIRVQKAPQDSRGILLVDESPSMKGRGKTANREIEALRAQYKEQGKITVHRVASDGALQEALERYSRARAVAGIWLVTDGGAALSVPEETVPVHVRLLKGPPADLRLEVLRKPAAGWAGEAVEAEVQAVLDGEGRVPVDQSFRLEVYSRGRRIQDVSMKIDSPVRVRLPLHGPGRTHFYLRLADVDGDPVFANDYIRFSVAGMVSETSVLWIRKGRCPGGFAERLEKAGFPLTCRSPADVSPAEVEAAGLLVLSDFPAGDEGRIVAGERVREGGGVILVPETGDVVRRMAEAFPFMPAPGPENTLQTVQPAVYGAHPVFDGFTSLSLGEKPWALPAFPAGRRADRVALWGMPEEGGRIPLVSVFPRAEKQVVLAPRVTPPSPALFRVYAALSLGAELPSPLSMHREKGSLIVRLPSSRSGENVTVISEAGQRHQVTLVEEEDRAEAVVPVSKEKGVCVFAPPVQTCTADSLKEPVSGARERLAALARITGGSFHPAASSVFPAVFTKTHVTGVRLVPLLPDWALFLFGLGSFLLVWREREKNR